MKPSPTLRLVVALALWFSAAGCQTCADIKQDSRELIAKAKEGCSSDDECEFALLIPEGASSCLGLKCPTAVSTRANLAELRQQAQELSSDFDSCAECIFDECASPGALKAVCSSAGRCEAVNANAAR